MYRIVRADVLTFFKIEVSIVKGVSTVPGKKVTSCDTSDFCHQVRSFFRTILRDFRRQNDVIKVRPVTFAAV